MPTAYYLELLFSVIFIYSIPFLLGSLSYFFGQWGQGVVVENEARRGVLFSDECGEYDIDHYLTLIRFIDNNGVSHQFTSFHKVKHGYSSEPPPPYAVDSTVHVNYNPEHPDKASIMSSPSSLMVGLAIGIAGSCCGTLYGIIPLVERYMNNH